MQRIYLDANATTPLDPRVRDAMAPWLDCGNASSPHAEGRAARDAIDCARDQVAALIAAQPREIVFTSGATEANALALLGTVAARRCTRVLTSAVEHPSVLRTLEAVRDRVDLVVAPVRPDGCLPRETEVPAGTGLVSVMRANNETGAILPVKEIAARARAVGAVVHTDAVQACGKIPVDVEDLAVDLLTLSAHKMHGPKGVGALYVRRGARIDPLFFGGEHERGLRAGTENVAAIVGLGAAAERAAAEGDARRELWSHLHERCVSQLRAALPNAMIHTPEAAVPNTVCVTFPDVEGEAVLLALDLEGIAVATGSACSSGAAEPSHVLQAMGLTREQAERSIRISFHAQSCAEDVAACVDSLARVVKRLRALHV
ncbi:MAG: cysteine desulfurase family protein [Planctomycetota bacterium]|jgi:cysteine desulfurase